MAITSVFGGGGPTGARLKKRADPGPAPAGYAYDEATGQYTPRYQSAPSRNALYDKLSNLALTGLNTSTTMAGGTGAGVGAGAGSGGVSGVGAVPSPVELPPVAAPDAATTAAQGLEFGAAKSRAGAMGRASLDALRANLAERGILGGGTEARGLVDRLAAATNPLSDINVAQARELAETGRERSAQEYTGKIAQRGQDIGARGQDISSRIAQRGQDIQLQMQRSQQQQQYLQQVLSSLSRLLY